MRQERRKSRKLPKLRHSLYAKLGRYYKDNYNKITMRLEYDEEVDAAYIYLEYPLENGISKKQLN